MDGNFETIVVGPKEDDVKLVDNMAKSGNLVVTAVVTEEDSPVAKWCAEHGVENYSELGKVPKLAPGQLLVLLDEDFPSADIEHILASRGVSIVGRDVARLLSVSRAVSHKVSDKAAETLVKFRKLLEDYSPASKQSSTSVKLTACLTEAVSIWSAKGGAVLLGIPGDIALAPAAVNGAKLSHSFKLKPKEDSVLYRCYSHGQNEIIDDLSGREDELIPDIEASSAVCLSVRSDTSIHGVLILWSDKESYFDTDDIEALSLFSYYVSMLLEVDEIKERLEDKLLIDLLTGLHNRRQFDHRLYYEVKRASRYNFSVSLVIFDIDHLDEYNDSCGNMLGDLALSDIASILERGTREVDFVARVGGDEFAAILPETGRLGALRVAERLRDEVATYPFPMPEGESEAVLTVTAGIASFPSSAENQQELIERAYKALETAKKEGTNRVKLWEEG